MKTKPITFLLSLSFLFLFSGSVYGEEPEVQRLYYDSGKLKFETHFKNGKKECQGQSKIVPAWRSKSVPLGLKNIVC